MDLRTLTLDCKACGQQHLIEIDYDTLTSDQLNRYAPVLDNFVCENVARMYRVLGFAFDTRSGLLKQDNIGDVHSQIANGLRQQWGLHDFDTKLERFRELGLSFMGIPDEYYDLLRQIVDSYCCGYFYPAMTSAGALGERILNRLLLKTRKHYRSSQEYKSIYQKQSFDNWDRPISVLESWGVISSEVAKAFRNLKEHRNDAIHYREGYPFEENAQAAVLELFGIVNGQFNFVKRNDLFWVFVVPGEIWLRSEKEQDPFVKEFVIPHCIKLSAFCQLTQDQLIMGENAPLAPLSDEEFLAARREHKKPKELKS